MPRVAFTAIKLALDIRVRPSEYSIDGPLTRDPELEHSILQPKLSRYLGSESTHTDTYFPCTKSKSLHDHSILNCLWMQCNGSAQCLIGHVFGEMLGKQMWRGTLH